MIRLEIIQNSMSLLPTAALNRRTNVPSARRKSAIATATAAGQGTPKRRHRDDDGDEQHEEGQNGGKLDLESNAHQRIGGKRADQQGKQTCSIAPRRSN